MAVTQVRRNSRFLSHCVAKSHLLITNTSLGQELNFYYRWAIMHLEIYLLLLVRLYFFKELRSKDERIRASGSNLTFDLASESKCNHHKTPSNNKNDNSVVHLSTNNEQVRKVDPFSITKTWFPWALLLCNANVNVSTVFHCREQKYFWLLTKKIL